MNQVLFYNVRMFREHRKDLLEPQVAYKTSLITLMIYLTTHSP